MVRKSREYATEKKSGQNFRQNIRHLGIGEKGVGDIKCAGHMQLLADGGRVIKKDKVGAVLFIHIGEVMGAQFA